MAPNYVRSVSLMSSDDEDGGTERTLAKSEASSGLNRPKADKPRVILTRRNFLCALKENSEMFRS